MIRIKNRGSFDSTQLLLEGYKKLFLNKNIISVVILLLKINVT